MRVELGQGNLVAVAAGVAMLALAVWLLRVNRHHVLNRAFAVFLIVRGLSNVLFPVFVTVDSQGRFVAIGTGFDAVLAFPALYFAVAYLRAQRGRHPPAWLAWVCWVGGLATAAAWLSAPESLLLFDENSAVVRVGPLGATFALYFGLLLGIAYWLLRQHRTAPGPLRGSALLMSFAFAAFPLYQTNLYLMVIVGPTGSGPAILAHPVALVSTWASIGLMALFIPLAGLELLRHPSRGSRAYLALLVVPPLTATAPALAMGAGSLSWEQAVWLVNVVGGVWLLVMPILGTYALLRHQLFGVDLRVRWTIKQSTIAASFVAVFFMASEGSQALFQTRYNTLFGILATGGLVFALHPLQRVAERVADAAVPRDDGPGRRAEPALVYREQARVAWSDGALDRNERAMLDRLRETLGLSADECMRIERDVSRAS